MSLYLEFNEIPNEGKKTKWFQIVSKSHGFPLGDIRFYNKWRCYCFYPAPETFFNQTCMQDIMKFIRDIRKA